MRRSVWFHGYIRNLGRSDAARAASETLWKRQYPRHHTDKCLSSVKSRRAQLRQMHLKIWSGTIFLLASSTKKETCTNG